MVYGFRIDELEVLVAEREEVASVEVNAQTLQTDFPEELGREAVADLDGLESQVGSVDEVVGLVAGVGHVV